MILLQQFAGNPLLSMKGMINDMKKHECSVKGLRTPRILIWLLGLLHGKILRTGTIDPDTNLLCGSYITSKTMLYKEYCHKRVGMLEAELKGLYIKVSSLLLSYETLQNRLSVLNSKTSSPESNQEKRLAQQVAYDHSNAAKQKNDVVMQMAEIYEVIRSKEISCTEELAGTAEALHSRFATYAHGMLLRPVLQKTIPRLEHEGCLTAYQLLHRENIMRLADIVNGKGE